MRNTIQDTLAAHRNELVSLLSRYVARGNGSLQPHQMINELKSVIMEDEGMQKLKDSSFSKVLQSAQNGILRKWISRFDVWPYLETFAEDASNEIAAELQGVPDLIIGNYSDANLFATLLSYKLGITQCNIAYALERTKYPHSDIFWKKHQDKYHFQVNSQPISLQ